MDGRRREQAPSYRPPVAVRAARGTPRGGARRARGAGPRQPRTYDAGVSAPAPSHGPSDRQRLRLLLAGVAAFLTIGALQSLYGPMFPVLQGRYGVSVAQVGGVVSAHFAGSFLGVLAAGVVLVRLGYRRSLVSAATLIVVGAGVIGLVTTWPLALAAAFVAGLGFGQTTVAVNLMVARAYGQSGTGPLNALNGTYGLGAVLGPALVALATTALGASPAASVVVFGAVALGALAFTIATLRLRWLPVPRQPPRGRAGKGSLALALFMLMFFLYVATEIATPAWIPTHLGGRLGAANAALVASAFWAAITVGRFVVTPLAARLRPRDLVLGASLVALAGLVMAQLPGLAVPGYVLAGFGLAPVFPTTIAWLLQSFGDRGEQFTPLVIASGSLGPVLGAPAVGVVVAATSPDTVPSVLAGLAALLAASVMLTWWSGRRAERSGAAVAGTEAP